MRCSRVTPKRWASGRSTSCGRRSLRKKPPIAAFAADHGTNPAGSISSRSFCAMAMPWPCGMRSSAKRHAAASHAVVRETGVQDARLFCEYAANASGKVTNILSMLRIYCPETTQAPDIRRSFSPRSPNSPACRGRWRRSPDDGCGSRCSRRVPTRRYRAARCRRWSAGCRRRPC